MRSHLPDLPFKTNKSWSEWRTSHVMHIPSSPRAAGRTETVSAPSEQKPSPWNPLHPFLEIFSGRNCAVLKQIYFNTRHNIWTNKKKKKNIFIFFYQGAKKTEKRTFGFSLVCRFCILTSSLRRSMFYFAARRRRHV